MTPARPMLRAGALLAAFAVFAATVLAGVHALTRDQITAAQQARLLRELNAVLPNSRYDNALATDTVTLDDPALGEGARTVYLARKGERPVASIFTVTAPDGYSGPIELLVGVQVDGQLTGVRVTQHRETPGLGDKIETRKSSWILSFDGLGLGNTPERDWAVRKDGGRFDQFTGATITPRAVVAAVHRTLQVAAARQHEWFTGVPAPGADAAPPEEALQ
jgi:Na+-translocating ferredoxin:NAD+ oxidoreductase subunit G